MSIVGALVAPVDPIASTGSTPGVTASGDFCIGGMYFKVASDDQNPYQRATAQFRKDQLDTAAEPGDQSLLGYWTRGQFSFHAGEGIIYYDSANTGEVAYRYHAGDRCDITYPGRVTLYAGSTVAATGASVTAVTYNDAGVRARLDGGTLYVAGTAVSGVTGAVSLCTDGSSFYVATAGSSNQAIYSVTSAGVATKQYTHTVDPAFLMWAKSRLFMADANGAIYQVAATATTPPQALASGDAVCTIAGTTGWSGAEAPGGLYMARGRNVYVFNVDSSGALPTLQAGVVAAQLPPGETVKAIAYNLGSLVFVTSKGVRVAEIVNNFGSDRLAFGALIFRGSGVSAAAHSSGAVCVVDGDLWFVDFAQAIGQTLTFAYHRVAADGSYVGVAGSPSGPAPFTSTRVDLLSGTATAGWLQLGLQRFGTLEPKKFETVRVKASGGGFIDISKVSATGSVSKLYTMDLSAQTDVTLGLAEADPIEALALRFDLRPNGAQVPTLLGYQLQSLPCPKRQRMIRVPLMCFDHEVRPAAPRAGHRGWAWERLNALENMEKSGGTFTFTDYRTGESGECYIESVEFSNTTPPGPKSSAFGGYAFVTLRKL